MCRMNLAAALLAVLAVVQTPAPEPESESSAPAVRSVRRPGREPVAKGFDRWLSEPRHIVLVLVVTTLIIGTARRLRQALRARRAVSRLDSPNVTVDDVAAASAHGRTGLAELFQMLGTHDDVAIRNAAGHALSVLWARDELIREEEKALVVRGFQVNWRARRRYPRTLRGPIPIGLDYGVSFLREDGGGVGPSRLEWSYRLTGTRRASLEAATPWRPGTGSISFELTPGDFETDGPHRLVFQARVRTVGLTDNWEHELPHLTFSFEFDPRLDVQALLASHDEERVRSFARSVRLVAEETDAPAFLPLNGSMAMRNVPALEIVPPLPCDIAHQVTLEIEGVAEPIRAGSIVVAGQGGGSASRFPLGPVTPIPNDALDRPGPGRIRAHLTPDPDRGWADPNVRSVWPGNIETDWIDVEIARI